MANINVAFGQTLLAMVMPVVRKVTSSKERQAAWVIKVGRDHWEFHGPNNFYWHGSADGAYDARHNGWNAWLENLKADHDELVARLENLDND